MPIIELTYSTKMIINFDRMYDHNYNGNLDSAINFATQALYLHNFDTADIIDATTGEVIAIVKRNLRGC